jgi:hypothetical protein
VLHRGANKYQEIVLLDTKHFGKVCCSSVRSIDRFLLCFLQDVHLIMLRVCEALFNNVVGSISGFDNRWEDAEHGDG